jgi:hypothetical protein
LLTGKAELVDRISEPSLSYGLYFVVISGITVVAIQIDRKLVQSGQRRVIFAPYRDEIDLLHLRGLAALRLSEFTMAAMRTSSLSVFIRSRRDTDTLCLGNKFSEEQRSAPE